MLPLSNILRAVIFISVTIIFIRPQKKEIFLWIFANLFFVINDIGAIKNGFFQFTHPDFLKLPVWEFVAWGFWILYLYKLLPHNFPAQVDLRTIVMAILFSLSFVVIPQKNLILYATSSLLLVYLLIFPMKYNFIWLLGFSVLGGMVETAGLYFNHWTYPAADLDVAILQFLVMWAGVGVIFRNLLGPFLRPNNSN